MQSARKKTSCGGAASQDPVQRLDLTPLSFDSAPRQICEQYPAARTSHTSRLIFKLAATPRVGGLRDQALFSLQQRPSPQLGLK